MEAIPQDHPLRRLFAAWVEHEFCTKVGMCDPTLTEYMVDVLVNFTHIDRFNAIRNAQGKRLEQIATMLAVSCEDAPASQRERDRMMYRHIGDFTLFWAGVYPEQIKKVHRHHTDVLVDYVSQGKRSYAIVSDLVGDDETPPPSLFRHLSEDFEYCLYGLNLVRRNWEHASSGADACEGPMLS